MEPSRDIFASQTEGKNKYKQQLCERDVAGLFLIIAKHYYNNLICIYDFCVRVFMFLHAQTGDDIS